MEQIQVQGFGEATNFDAAHVIFGDTIGAVILEPQIRADFNSGERNGFDEDSFRQAVRNIVADFEDTPDSIIFDPARDNQTSETV